MEEITQMKYKTKTIYLNPRQAKLVKDTHHTIQTFIEGTSRDIDIERSK